MGFQLHGGHGHSHGGGHSKPTPTNNAAASQSSTSATASSKPLNNGSFVNTSQDDLSSRSVPTSNYMDLDNVDGVVSITTTAANTTDNGHQHFNNGATCDSKNEKCSEKGQSVTAATTTTTTNYNYTEPHDHQHGENLNVRAAFIHVLGDVVQSIGVFLAALLIYFRPDWAIADPICTFVFSIIVLCTTFGIMKDALLVNDACRSAIFRN